MDTKRTDSSRLNSLARTGRALGALSGITFLVLGLKQMLGLLLSGQYSGAILPSVTLVVGIFGIPVLWWNMRNYFGRLKRITLERRAHVKFASPISRFELKRLIGKGSVTRNAKSPVVLYTDSGIEILGVSTDSCVANVPYAAIAEVRFPVLTRTQPFEASTAPFITTQFGRAQLSVFAETSFGDWVGLSVGDQDKFKQLITKK